MTTTVVITGATGFVGRALVAECLSRGDMSVRVIVRNAAAASEQWAGQEVEVVQGDLHDAAALDRAVQGASTLVHLVYLHGGAEANLPVVRSLAEASQRAGVRRIVHCSTAAVIGPGASGAIREETPAQPRGEYQVAKLAVEGELKKDVPRWGELAILRPTEIVGPGGEGLRQMIQRLRTDGWPMNEARRVIFGARRFNYVCIRNVVAGLLLLAESPLAQNGEVFYLSDDDDPENNYASVEGRILEAMGRRRSISGPTLPRSVLSLAYRMFPERAPPNRTYSTSKIRQLGYREVTSLSATINEVVAFELGQGAAGRQGHATAAV